MSELALQLIAENKKTRNPYLDLGNCGLTHLPKELGECVWLETLVLSNEWEKSYLEGKNWEHSSNAGKPNRIASVEGIEQLVGLQRLVVSGGYNGWFLADLSPLVGLLQLRSLDFSNTSVSDLSPLVGLSQLQNLRFNSPLVSDLSPLVGLLQLQSLDFSNTSVSDLGPLVGLLQLRSLDFSETLVSDLSPLAGLSQLKSLGFNWTSVSDLSPLVGLSQLQSLSLWSTLVSDLSPLVGLLQLQSIDFSETLVSDLIPLVGLLQLQSIGFNDTSVNDLSPLICLLQLQNLSFWGASVSDLGLLTGLLQLQSLNFSETSVSDLSPLDGLLQLQSLYFGSTSVSDLSPLSGLKGLQHLDFNCTLVSDLSPLVGLSQLQNLSFWSTPVSDLSPLVGLSQLQSLSLWSTPVSDLSPLSGLLQLQGLSFGSTSVSDLSPLSGLKGLQHLEFSSTLVNDLNPLSDLSTLDTIDCRDCPIKNLPEEIAFSGNGQQIRHYLLSNPDTPFNEVKLILSGNSRAGKTNTADFLSQGDDYQFSDEHNSSHGVLVDSWEVEKSLLPRDTPLDSLTVNIWDFGGQDFYHGTHNLFFRHGAVYALLWEHQKAASGGDPQQVSLPEDYWLEDIRHHAPGSAVLVVQNKTDRDGEHGLREEWLELYDLKRTQEFHLSIRQAALKKGAEHWEEWDRFVGKLVRRLSEDLAKTEAKINHRWLDIRDHIRELQTDAELSPDNPFAASTAERPYLSKAEFTACCDQVIPEFEQFVDAFLTVFDHRGALIHFAENEKLRDWVFLKPDWVAQKIYHLLDEGLLNDGTFNRAFAERRLGTDTDLLLELMVAFGVIFEDPRRAGTYVAVQYLPKFDANNDADIHYEPLATPCLAISLPLFHQQRILRQLIVRIGSDGTYKQRLLRHDCLLVLAPDGSRIRVTGERGEHTGVLKIFAEKPDTWGLQMALEVLLLYFEQYEEFGFPIPERTEMRRWEMPPDYERLVRSACDSGAVFEEFVKALKEQHGGHSTKNVAGFSIVNLKNLPKKRAVAKVWGHFFADNLLRARTHWADLDNATESQKTEKITRAHRFHHLTTALHLSTNQGQNWVHFAHLIDHPQAPNFPDTTGGTTEAQSFEPLLKALGFETPKKPLRVFVSYSKEDWKDFVLPLLGFLEPLEDAGKIALWQDRKLAFSKGWDEGIRFKLEEADLVLFLVSEHSLKTPYIKETEVPKAMERCAKGLTKILSVILSTCLWDVKDEQEQPVFPPAKFPVLPTKAKPVNQFPDQNLAWQEVADALEKIWTDVQR